MTARKFEAPGPIDARDVGSYLHAMVRHTGAYAAKVEEGLLRLLPRRPLPKISLLLATLKGIPRTPKLDFDSLVAYLKAYLGRVAKVSTASDPVHGSYILLEVGLPASEALKLWRGLAKLSRLAGVWIAVKWTGATDATKDELLDAAVDIMAESGFGPEATAPFDAVELVRESRE